MINNGHKIKKGQRFVVMGLGVSGRAAVRFIKHQGAEVAVSDSRIFDQLPKEEQSYIERNNIKFEGGGHTERFCGDCDVVFVSPGVPTNLPLIRDLRDGGVEIVGELAIAAPYLADTVVVAVTGTNGKTTVTSLIGELLSGTGKEIFVGGNIGTPLFDYLDSGIRKDFVVLELSSFQLESAGIFRPHIALLLNITPDHLDRHGDMVRYARAKINIFLNQQKNDKAILSAYDPMCNQVKSLLNGQEKYCFGDIDSGCHAIGEGNSFTVNVNGCKDSYSLAGTALDSHTGLLNSQAAVLAVSLLGLHRKEIEKGLRTFTLASHRLQYVRCLEGVNYYNDSKATNTGALLSSLANFSGNVILIAGGRDKGEDYSVLKKVFSEKLKTLILIGESSANIAAGVKGSVLTTEAASMEEAVHMAAGQAVAGDTVLLAPACASFDMFNNYSHRGEIFMRLVHELAEPEVSRAL